MGARGRGAENGRLGLTVREGATVSVREGAGATRGACFRNSPTKTARQRTRLMSCASGARASHTPEGVLQRSDEESTSPRCRGAPKRKSGSTGCASTCRREQRACETSRMRKVGEPRCGVLSRGDTSVLTGGLQLGEHVAENKSSVMELSVEGKTSRRRRKLGKRVPRRSCCGRRGAGRGLLLAERKE